MNSMAYTPTSRKMTTVDRTEAWTYCPALSREQHAATWVAQFLKHLTLDSHHAERF